MVNFVKCDITQWKDQVALFKQCLSTSKSNTIDLVIANAGIAGSDPVYQNSEAAKQEEPDEPNLKLLTVNLCGTMYTIKLALHYFTRQFSFEEDRSADRCLILVGSVAGYLDQPGSPQYSAAKFGLRGVMRSLRRTTWRQGIRVNLIAPWFVKTNMQSEELVQQAIARGVEYATVSDAAAAALKFASDVSISGRALAVVPRKWAPHGYMDLDLDDFREDSEFYEWQDLALKASHRA